MTEQHDDKVLSIEEQRLVKQAASLGATHQPGRDLWTDIKQQIQTTSIVQPTSRWMPFALAASLLISVISIGFSGYLYVNQSNQTISHPVASKDYISAIEQPYILARAAYLEEMVVEGSDLSPEIRAVLKENLDIIDTAISQIRSALKDNPNDGLLLDTLIQTREKEMELFRQLTTQRFATI